MAMKQFKAESKRLLDLMIHSIYTHQEIFLRELISNASDAIDKLYYKSLQDGDTGLNRDDFCITIDIDKEKRNLIITDNGCGMTKEVQKKLFNTMITTKGKNGTGLGMFMSYSTIKGHFNGDITFETEVNKGTTFNVILPLK